MPPEPARRMRVLRCTPFNRVRKTRWNLGREVISIIPMTPWFKIPLLVLALALEVHAAGTVGVRNTPVTRVRLVTDSGTVAVPTNRPVLYGVFWGTDPNNLQLSLPLLTSSTNTAGAIDAPQAYPVSGTLSGQTVYLCIRGWDASYGVNWRDARGNGAAFGETQVRGVLLGPESGPAAPLWGTVFPSLSLSQPLTRGVRVGLGVLPNLSRTVDVGDRGTVDVVVPVTRESSTGSPLDFSTTVLVTTTNLTAVAGEDYVATTVAVTFLPHEITRSVRIPVVGGRVSKGEEQFGVTFVPDSSGPDLSSRVYVVTIRQARLSAVRRESGGAWVTFRTTDHQRYALESSADLAGWTVVPGAEDLAGTGGSMEVFDSTPDCCSSRFYRMRILP